MKTVAKIVSAISLLALIALPVAYFAEAASKPTMITWALVATIAWFGSAPFWMEKA